MKFVNVNIIRDSLKPDDESKEFVKRLKQAKTFRKKSRVYLDEVVREFKKSFNKRSIRDT